MVSLALVCQLLFGAGPSVLTIDVKPEGVEIKVDGKKAGTSGKPLKLKLKPGRHVVRLTHKGDAHEEEVGLKAGENKTYSWTFETAGAGTTNAPTEDAPSNE